MFYDQGLVKLYALYSLQLLKDAIFDPECAPCILFSSPQTCSMSISFFDIIFLPMFAYQYKLLSLVISRGQE